MAAERDAPLLAMRKALDRVLGWLSDEGCSCDGDDQREIWEHEERCAGTVERLLMHCQECFGRGSQEWHRVGGVAEERRCEPCAGTGKDLGVCGVGVDDMERLAVDWQALAEAHADRAQECEGLRRDAEERAEKAEAMSKAAAQALGHCLVLLRTTLTPEEWADLEGAIRGR